MQYILSTDTAQAIEHHTIDSAWVPKDLYFTYHLKLRHAIFGMEIEDETVEEGIEIAQVSIAPVEYSLMMCTVRVASGPMCLCL